MGWGVSTRDCVSGSGRFAIPMDGPRGQLVLARLAPDRIAQGSGWGQHGLRPQRGRSPALSASHASLGPRVDREPVKRCVASHGRAAFSRSMLRHRSSRRRTTRDRPTALARGRQLPSEALARWVPPVGSRFRYFVSVPVASSMALPCAGRRSCLHLARRDGRFASLRSGTRPGSTTPNCDHGAAAGEAWT